MKVRVGIEEIDLNTDLLKVTEASISDILSTFAATYAYYGSRHNEANYILSTLEDQYDQAFARKVKELKEQGATDKLSESSAKTDPDVIELKENVRKARRTKDHLWTFLRALEKQHENAISMATNLRQEMYFHGRTHVKSHDDNGAKSLQEIIS
jgi:erythromycin esterase-like protein